MAEQRAPIDAHKRAFREFLESDDHEGRYIDKLKQCISDQKYRLIVNVNDLRNFNRELAAQLIKKPREYIIAMKEAAADSAKDADPTVEKVLKTRDLQVGFEGSFGSNLVSPRGLLSSFLNSLVEVEGIVTKCSSVRPKLVRSVQYCAQTKAYRVLDHRDEMAPDIGVEIRGRVRLQTNGSMSREDEEGNQLETEFGLCQYKDYQVVTLQEMPERARVGQLPRSIEVIVEHDLVDRVKPGDRVQCVGVYQPLAGQLNNGQCSSFFRSVLMSNNISVIGKEIGAVRLTGVDVGNIREISARPDVLDIMARSLCPSIFGHEQIKKALILQLLGGCERNLENGTHLRGDVNIMMVGDPSTAKSQLLRAVMEIAPLAISTTGRGSSGVGLTAAVTMDAETGEKRLEAGAMVLADRGVVCIDEFDKMGENDRVAIHEVMEQQTVTIAKAGIHASLNARCSVLAAANPVYGQYDRTRRPQENIGLPDSLLSRFDLLFIVLDELNPSLDRRLSEHVIRSHQYRRPGTIMEPEPLNQASSLCLDDNSEVVQDTPVWQRGGRSATGETSKGDGRAGDVLTKEFLRKYIHYAKNRIYPVLTEDAMEGISTAYAGMRAKQTQKNLPVTARSLETIIRLSSANAKARLSASVEEQDVNVAVELMNFVYFHEVADSMAGDNGGHGMSESAGYGCGSGSATAAGAGGAGRRLREHDDDNENAGGDDEQANTSGEYDDDLDLDNDEDDDGDYSVRGKKRLRKRSAHDEGREGLGSLQDLPKETQAMKIKRLQETINRLGEEVGDSRLLVTVVMERFNAKKNNGTSSVAEMEQLLLQLENDNKVMIDDGVVHIL